MKQRLILLFPVLLMAFMLTGCGGEIGPPIRLAGAVIPNFSDDKATSTSSVLVNNRKEETVAFPKANLSLLEKYRKWFQKNGWTPVASSEDVTAASYTYTKNQSQALLTFNTTDGIRIRVSTPKDGAPPSQ